MSVAGKLFKLHDGLAYLNRGITIPAYWNVPNMPAYDVLAFYYNGVSLLIFHIGDMQVYQDTKQKCMRSRPSRFKNDE